MWPYGPPSLHHRHDTPDNTRRPPSSQLPRWPCWCSSTSMSIALNCRSHGYPTLRLSSSPADAVGASLPPNTNFIGYFSHLLLPSQLIDLSLSDPFSQGCRCYVTDCRICTSCFCFRSYGIFSTPCYLGSLLTCFFILTAYRFWINSQCLSSICVILTRFTPSCWTWHPWRTIVHLTKWVICFLE